MTHSVEDHDCSQAYLFLDDRWVQDSALVTRFWHQARKYPQPILVADRPWEYNCPVAYGTVLRRNGKWSMWYTTWTRSIPSRVCYAHSDDGIHWDKPDLHLHAFNGNTNNNVVLVSCEEPNGGAIDNISVIDDPDDLQWPLKAMYWDSGDPTDSTSKNSTRGYYAARSSDGVHWETLGCVLPGYGDRFNAMSYKHHGKFIVMVREPNYLSYGKGRVVSLIESEDLIHWSSPKIVLQADMDDPMRMECYSATCFPYAGQMLGSLERMHACPDKVDSEIIWSDDASCWHRARTRPRFIEWGAPGSWDDTWINLTSNAPIRVGGELWFYYSGRSGAHGVAYPHNHGAIGLATLRQDGFCSLYGEGDRTRVVTKPIAWSDADLFVNFETQRDSLGRPAHLTDGRIRVALRDGQGTTLPGFSFDDCQPLDATSFSKRGICYAPVAWQQGQSAKKFAGREIQIAFQIHQAHLYAFKAGDSISP